MERAFFWVLPAVQKQFPDSLNYILYSSPGKQKIISPFYFTGFEISLRPSNGANSRLTNSQTLKNFQDGSKSIRHESMAGRNPDLRFPMGCFSRCDCLQKSFPTNCRVNILLTQKRQKMNQEKLIAELMTGKRDWKNFSYQRNKSALGYDADIKNFLGFFGPSGLSALGFRNYDSDFKNFNNDYGMPPGMTFAQRSAWLNDQVSSGAMTTSRIRLSYTAVAGSPQDVDISLFASVFTVNANAGVFNPDGDLVFTNAGGDFVTITCQTINGSGNQRVTMRQLYDMTLTQPFVIGFCRLDVKTQAQFGNPMGIILQGQFGGYSGNSIVPADFIDPYQYQLLRVDVPMNINASNQEGFSWTVDQDQTGTGIGMTLFIPQTLNPNKQLRGKNPVRMLNDGVIPNFQMPSGPAQNPQQEMAQAIQMVAADPQVKQIISSGVGTGMAQDLVRTELPRILGIGM